MNRSWKGLIISLLILGLFLGGCSREGIQPPEENPGNGSEITPEEEATEVEVPGEIEGSLAPVLELKNQRGEAVSLGKRADKPVVLTFWVQWNETAINQLKILENVYALLKNQVDFLGVHASAFDDLSQGEMEALLTEIDCSYDILSDEDAEAQQAYFVGSFPTTFLIDSEGKITATYTSLIEEDELLEALEKLLEGTP